MAGIAFGSEVPRFCDRLVNYYDDDDDDDCVNNVVSNGEDKTKECTKIYSIFSSNKKHNVSSTDNS